jgi:hypothetical protein
MTIFDGSREDMLDDAPPGRLCVALIDAALLAMAFGAGWVLAMVTEGITG